MSKARKSAKSLFLGSLFSKVIGFIGTIILARILFPEDYGYLLMAIIFTAFTQMIGEMGFEHFYLQEKIHDEKHEQKILDITFKLRILVNTLLFIIQFFGSYIIESYFEKEIIGQLLRIFAFDYLILAPLLINLYILRKKLEYLPEVYANMSRDISGTGFKILFASMGLGALSFAFASVIGNFIRLLIILYFQRFKPNILNWDKKIFKKVYFFGKHSFIGGIAMYFSNYIDKILLSNYFPVNQIGFYSFATAQSNVASSYLLSAQESLIMSYIAKNKDKPLKLINILSEISYFIGLILLPITFTLFFYSESIFHFVFGAKWDNSIAIFELFLWQSFVSSLFLPLLSILTAYGYPQIASKLMIVKLFTLAIILFITVKTSDSIFIYGVVFAFVSIVFTIIKSTLGLYVMKQSLLAYIYRLNKLVLLSIIYIITYYFIDNFNLSQYVSLFCYIILIFLWSLFFNLYLFRKRFILTISTILGNNHKITNILKFKL